MKTIKQNRTIAILFVIASLAISSCQKEKLQNTIATHHTDVSWADDSYNDLLKFAVGINKGSFKNEDINASCANITDDTVSMPHTRTFDYGSGCVDPDGKTHKGQVILTFNSGDFMNTPGAYVAVSFNNYFVDDNQITGTLNVQNTGTDGNGFTAFQMDADAKRIHANNGGTDSVAGQMIVEWVAGSSTSESVDDEFSFTGSASGSAATGETFQVTVLQALVKKRAPGCSFYVKGETKTQISGQSDRYLDYGDGTCDDLGVETVDGNSQTITLD